MEQLNRVELRGIVGSVRINEYQEHKSMCFTLATNLAYKDRNGNTVIDTTWHTVARWMQSGDPELKKGDRVYVVGRLRNQKYTDADGRERTMIEILANKIELLANDEPSVFERREP